MSFWWVSQNKTHNEELNGGYLWAPKRTKSGKTIYHWDTMKDVRKGDVIFSYYRQYIVAFSEARGSAYNSDNPFKKSGKLWEIDGRKIDVSYTILESPIKVQKIVKELQEMLKKQGAYRPLNVNGTGNQGYLFPLTDEAGRFLLSYCK